MITAQGVSASIDMGLHIVAQLLGTTKAKAYQTAIEYFPEPPLGLYQLKEADPKTLQLARKIMQADAIKDLRLPDIIRNAKQLWRLIKGSYQNS